VMAERPGESKRDESNTNDTNSSTADILAASGREAVSPAREGLNKTRSGEEYEAGAANRESSRTAAGAGSVQAMQAGLGGDRRADSERARHAVCVPVLPEVAPRSGTCKRIQEDAARAVGPLAPSGGIGNRWHAH
jgi:hypothetical protein